MDIETFRDYCLGLAHVTEEQPFGPDALVYKVGGKVFLILMLRDPLSFNVKCEPERALEQREAHEEITPGYHMNKKHWNTIILSGQLDWQEIQDLIKHSYNLVTEKG